MTTPPCVRCSRLSWGESAASWSKRRGANGNATALERGENDRNLETLFALGAFGEALVDRLAHVALVKFPLAERARS